MNDNSLMPANKSAQFASDSPTSLSRLLSVHILMVLCHLLITRFTLSVHACGCGCVAAQATMARLVVDCRERALIQSLALKGAPHRVLSLPVGDVSCTYDDGGCAWVLEREHRVVCLPSLVFVWCVFATL